jgi:hypothetical protein
MKTRGIFAVAALMLLACTAIALEKPSFTGEWKMNPSKSDFGMMPAPSSMTQKITHSEPDLRVVSTQVGQQGEFTSDSKYTTDGKECVNKFREFERKSTLKWEGDILVIESKMDIQGTAVTISEKWSLSEDGKTLTINRHFSSPQGEGDAKTVLEKQ